ncbi:hypothetical protein G7062_02465 [Erysipelothrix sp. HDW6C]|uniref:hypothetical protein n=1 Tax=Erysipelothrix sp. HDW6C TaxID=2714930 RepID=UPI00140D5202|nr:hypothetical protein [Erysipelothrix sp. HDW6C]QIK69220.1 hypothetical protein G7062_02465 [Erysipelothrix sp. HDW6C]
MKTEVAKHYRKHATDTMELKYDVLVNGQNFVYSLTFSSTMELIEESLFKRLNNKDNIIYVANRCDLEFGRSMVLVKDLPYIMQMHREHFGKHTLLSILAYIQFENKEVAFKSTLNDFVHYIAHIRVSVEGQYTQEEFFNFWYDCDVDVFGGITNAHLRVFLEHTQPVLNDFIRSIFPLVEEVHYEFHPIKPDVWKYQLKTLKRTSLGVVDVPVDELPSGLTQVLRISVSLLDLLVGNTLIYDQFDLKLHQSPVLNIIENIMPRLSGQSIFALDSLDTMNRLEPASIYVTNIDDLNFSVKAIEEIAPTQPNHNIRNRYEQGTYGKPVRARATTIYAYIDKYRNTVMEIYKRANY